MGGRSAIFNLLTCLTLAGTGLVVVVVAVLLVAPGILPGFLRVPTQPAQVAVITPAPPATATVPPAAYPTLPPEWTATPSPAPTATDTPVPTEAATDTPTVTDTPEATASPADSPTSAASAATAVTPASGNVVQMARFANVRSGPGVAYPIVSSLNAAQTAPVIGRDNSGFWFAISFDGAPQGTGWVSKLVATYSGDINSLPVIQAAAPPPPTAVPPTNTPATVGPPTNTPLPNVGGANGLQTISFSLEETTGAVDDNIWFDFKVVNNSSSTISGYGFLAAHTDQGVTAVSWNAPLVPGKVLTWRDHINFPTIGVYQVYLGICYASQSACRNGGAAWTPLSNSISVTID